jgi:hypothetical protein
LLYIGYGNVAPAPVMSAALAVNVNAAITARNKCFKEISLKIVYECTILFRQ